MNKRSGDIKEDIVKESLFSFLMQQTPSAQISEIDEIVLSYVVSILEELGDETSGDVEEAFDAEGFCEMMAAYFPEFSTISLPKVCEWMFELEASLRASKDNNDSLLERNLADLLTPIPLKRNHNSSSECSSNDKQKSHRKHQLSEASDGSCSSDSSGEYYAQEDINEFEQSHILQEMFPSLSINEIRHCLMVAGGDVASATQLVLHRQETGQTLNHLPNVVQPKFVANDQELKSRILARYSFVDKDDDFREHRPVVPKPEPKKLIRYRDNKIVSLKGEKYTEVKKEDEEITKKCVPVVKPIRQNKYH